MCLSFPSPLFFALPFPPSCFLFMLAAPSSLPRPEPRRVAPICFYFIDARGWRGAPWIETTPTQGYIRGERRGCPPVERSKRRLVIRGRASMALRGQGSGGEEEGGRKGGQSLGECASSLHLHPVEFHPSSAYPSLPIPPLHKPAATLLISAKEKEERQGGIHGGGAHVDPSTSRPVPHVLTHPPSLSFPCFASARYIPRRAINRPVPRLHPRPWKCLAFAEPRCTAGRKEIEARIVIFVCVLRIRGEVGARKGTTRTVRSREQGQVDRERHEEAARTDKPKPGHGVLRTCIVICSQRDARNGRPREYQQRALALLHASTAPGPEIRHCVRQEGDSEEIVRDMVEIVPGERQRHMAHVEGSSGRTTRRGRL
ncbi:hypothetical protein B0H13DRAFT_1913598 [Mycena leptocephala]|nr:hypothetical protein B0H13DRAFT_1913598 [Mycena leptocephala]